MYPTPPKMDPQAAFRNKRPSGDAMQRLPGSAAAAKIRKSSSMSIALGYQEFTWMFQL